MTERPYGKIVHDDSALVAKQRRRALASFRRDDRLEALLELQRDDPERFTKLFDNERLAVRQYAASRAAATEAARAEEGDEAA